MHVSHLLCGGSCAKSLNQADKGITVLPIRDKSAHREIFIAASNFMAEEVSQKRVLPKHR